MRLSKISLACLMATSGLSLSPIATADTTDGFEFHGYFRAGAIFSVEDDLKRAKISSDKKRP